MMDAIDRKLINELQRGFPVCDTPFAVLADQFAIDEIQIIKRIESLLTDGVLTRFGPLFNAERLGGALSLCAMRIPEDEFDDVAEKVNALDEVAHNYQRDHEMNMWFVLATETPADKLEALQRIEEVTGYPVYDMPKEKEFFVGLFFDAER